MSLTRGVVIALVFAVVVALHATGNLVLWGDPAIHYGMSLGSLTLEFWIPSEFWFPGLY